MHDNCNIDMFIVCMTLDHSIWFAFHAIIVKLNGLLNWIILTSLLVLQCNTSPVVKLLHFHIAPSMFTLLCIGELVIRN